MKLTANVEYILNTLFESGYRADVVGGPVRDFLLGKEPSDYDITTSATPDKVKEIFRAHRTVDTGIKHGTVSLILDGEQYEITTYRVDGEYKDARHPESVSFTSLIGEDLARRDFTVNAIAYNPRDGITDPYGGRADIESKLIRAVGDPDLRFREDALRILRGIRFSATLGFRIDIPTAAAMRRCAPLLSKVSSERIFTEWHKLVSGRYAYGVLKEFSDIISVFLPELSGLCLPSRELFDKADFLTRQTALFALSVRENASSAYEAAMRRLKTDAKTREQGARALSALDLAVPSGDGEVGRLLAALGAEDALRLTELNILLGRANGNDLDAVSRYISLGKPYKISDLAIGGDELVAIGISGRAVGKTLSALLYAVIDGELDNTPDALLRAARSDSENHGK